MGQFGLMSDSDQVTAITDVHRAPPRKETSDCLVVIYRRHGILGARFKLDGAPIRIGREDTNDVHIDDDGASRHHARLDRVAGRLMLTDVGSTNGTLLNNNELMNSTALQNGDEVKIGSTILKYLSASDLEGAVYEQIYQNAITDYLTQLCNKRHFEDCLAFEFSRTRRYQHPLSLLVIDIDFFKRVNDTHGHQVGDLALAASARVIRECVRAEDIPGRFGGEEIVVLLPETTLQQATIVAEKIRGAMARNQILHRNGRFTVTVSIGCAQLHSSDADTASFIGRADAKMYEAKAAGRDCVRS